MVWSSIGIILLHERKDSLTSAGCISTLVKREARTLPALRWDVIRLRWLDAFNFIAIVLVVGGLGKSVNVDEEDSDHLLGLFSLTNI
jgi:hypothetical protein